MKKSSPNVWKCRNVVYLYHQKQTNTRVMKNQNNTLTATEIIRRGREKTVISYYEALAKIEAKPEISRIDEINAKIYREYIAEHAKWSEQFQD